MSLKKTYFIFVVLYVFIFTSCNNSSPNNTNHIEFMEIQVDGNVYSFGDKLSQKGYEFYADDSIYCQLVYFGVYLNKQATIRLDYEETTKEIKNARVIFSRDIPNANALIQQYTEKYGECQMESKNGLIYYTWKVNGGRLIVSTASSPVLAIEYHKK